MEGSFMAGVVVEQSNNALADPFGSEHGDC